jgi:hypothetical protein
MKMFVYHALSPLRSWRLVILALTIAAFGSAAGLATLASAKPSVGEVTSVVTMPATDEVAFEILGRAAPQPQTVPPGFARNQLAVDPVNKPVGPRFVHQSFGFSGSNIARLDAYRGVLNRAEGDPVTIGGKSVTVATKQLRDGSTNVSYAWNQDGLGLTLNINLVHGVSRADADAIVASMQ